MYKRICIDRLEQIDLSTLKAEDLRLRFWTGQALSTGYGRDKKYSYRTGIETPIGDVEIGVWFKAAEYVIERDGLQNEVKRLAPYISRHNPFPQRDIQVRILDACLSRLHCNIEWIYFTEYNEKYHPELLVLWDNREQTESENTADAN